ncbi:MAG TPA: glycoside hydrolase domain-containing protein, partial [Chthonomonadales bacterium]|nr:glycoside hydrolase domain-containing protein [Chthonomonadales bacterium]
MRIERDVKTDDRRAMPVQSWTRRTILWGCATLLLGFSGSIARGVTTKHKEPVDYVSPNIGGIGQLLTATVPYVQAPHGMARLAPITTPGINDRYLADKIYGFPAGPAMLMASTGKVSTQPKDYASTFDHDFETTTPYYYAADLQSWGIKSEVTATQTAAYYRFTLPAGSTAHLVLSMEDGSELKVVGDSVVEGSERAGGTVAKLSENDGETREYFYAKFSKPFRHYQTWQKDALSESRDQAGDHIGFVAEEAGTGGEQVEVRVGLSYISTEQAQKNLQREMAGRSFEQVKEQTRTLWNKTLGAVQIDGGSERQRTIFYTALYRSLGRMTDITEDGRYFSGYDHKVHESNGHDFYVDDGLWDTYRSLHPLQLLLEAPRQED